ncbi:hypothetical protein NPE20_10860 [Mucilaginibacter sp. JC4]|uniref:Uncharacterized protein n=1 Tax=Mucilaginibacter aquariorum TaxID=2967225 RepID=A0ABT1T1K4_9SPHI|nr:hypothetical protein [Mucilaginibacter aquariorum]
MGIQTRLNQFNISMIAISLMIDRGIFSNLSNCSSNDLQRQGSKF